MIVSLAILVDPEEQESDDANKPDSGQHLEYGQGNDREPHDGHLPTFRVIVYRNGAIDTDTESSCSLITNIPGWEV
ncbi:hypothetical protein EJ997_05060 [Flaviflexus ciconiae]|uniref:Uncharacterized protein n=1 Tax=Flaviflexus ciconiae TaxID=2496867 RepID=A0A3S9PWQ1_9ACTO|nr:hypothetical protein [Flaviflexus ciconiae]AZQ76803.1 hypothetical protein EJ997_05060 [Flaviflexus ciconiae]